MLAVGIADHARTGTCDHRSREDGERHSSEAIDQMHGISSG
jgi:hypothetical protein